MQRAAVTSVIRLVVLASVIAGSGCQIAFHDGDADGGGGFAGTKASGGVIEAGSLDSSGGNTVIDSGACGAIDQACCENRMCNEGLGCQGGIVTGSRCRPCGSKGQVCCQSGAECNDGLTCRLSVDSGRFCTVAMEAASCVDSCDQPGGQYCGRIGNRCGGVLECGECRQAGFTCGGAGVENLCGAPADSGACELAECKTPSRTYCGVIGDDCGGARDCGGCPSGVTCGEAGVSHACGAPPDADWEPPPPVPPPPPPPPY